MSFTAMANLVGIKPTTAHLRWRNGMGLGAALLQPVGSLNQATGLKHGLSWMREYGIWEGMRHRCRRHPHYAGRGISTCARWDTFEAFLEDMGPCPPGLSLDRIDGALGYFKENCRWATKEQQSQNTYRNVFLTLNGETACIAEWSRRVGIPHNVINWRHTRGWPIEKILTLKSTPRNSVCRKKK